MHSRDQLHCDESCLLRESPWTRPDVLKNAARHLTKDNGRVFVFPGPRDFC